MPTGPKGQKRSADVMGNATDCARDRERAQSDV